jgi:hypothetical protein
MVVATRRLAVAALLVAASTSALQAPRAEAFNPIKPLCTVGGLISGLVGKACTVVEHGGRLISAGKKLASGHLGSAVKTVLGSGGSSIGSKATFALGLAAVVTWVLGGARYALQATAGVIARTTSPRLESTWFSATYWRVAGIAAVLTLPFLFAAAIQALVQSDLSLLARAALGYLPLAMLCVGIAAPLTMLLLAASDQMSALVSSAAGHASARFLSRATAALAAVTVLARSPFLVFFAGILTVGAAVALWVELLLRAAAVYVIVLLLPLAFAAFVWPARRIWAIRTVEVLIALILSKFLIVAVLSLGGAALGEGALTSVSGMLAAFVLLAMGTLAPWALLRLLPLGELAAGAVGSLRGELTGSGGRLLTRADGIAASGHEWDATTAEMRRHADSDDGFELADTPGAPVERPAEPLVGAAAAAPGAPSPGSVAADGGGGTGTTSGGDAGVGAGGDPGSSRERSPGLGRIWQLDDFSWPVLRLGLEHGWPPPPLGPDPDPGGATPPESERPGPSDTGEAASGAPQDRDANGTPHEVHDPTPPPQNPPPQNPSEPPAPEPGTA